MNLLHKLPKLTFFVGIVSLVSFLDGKVLLVIKVSEELPGVIFCGGEESRGVVRVIFYGW